MKASRMKALITFLGMIAATGCVTTKNRITTLTTTPPGATATIGNFGECETPCTVQIINPVTIVFAKIGYTPQSINVEPGEKSVTIELQLAAPTEGVEENTLPEL